MKTSRRIIIVFAISLALHGALLAIELRAKGSLTGSGYVAEIVARSVNSFVPANPEPTTQKSDRVVPPVASPHFSGVSVRQTPIRRPVAPTVVSAVPEVEPEAKADKLLEPEHIRAVAQQEQNKAEVDQLVTASVVTLTPNIRAESSVAKTAYLSTRTVRAIPRYAENPSPVYPELARRKGWQGEVRLLVEVSDRGYVKNLSIKRSSGYPVLDRSARQSVRLWRFIPAIEGNTKVASEVVVPVNFQLPVEG